MPMGPCALLDEIGLDVALSIFTSLASALGERLAVSPMLAAAVARGWLGRKSGQGLYVHSPEGRPAPTAAWPTLGLPASTPVGVIDEGIVESRLITPMAAEARLVLAEGVVSSPESLDLASVLGIGFPAFRGGLATYALNH
jgi:3-hydroxyacyl-CoA dehydrogenase/enoyl-CoA hydratase/3-hydroxybutyryl-CoA epimerase